MPHPFPPLDGSASKQQQFPSDGPEMGIDPSKRYTATMETSSPASFRCISRSG